MFLVSNLKSFNFDKFFEAVDYKDKAVIVNASDVARSQPPIRRERLHGGSLILMVAPHHLRPFDPKLALAAWR